MIRKIIPNFFTCLNLLCGMFAILFSFTWLDSLGIALTSILVSSIFVFMAVAFDFIDGLLARKLNGQSDFGKQLDSLADVVSFGVAPAFILFHLFLYPGNLFLEYVLTNPLSLSVFLIPIFSAIRLAKFNLDKKQKEIFLGLPTPASAIFIASLPFLPSKCFLYLVSNNYSFFLISVGLSLLMVIPLPMFSLKFKHYRWKENETRYIFLFLSLILAIAFREIGIPLIIILYILLSLFIFVYKKFLSSNN